MNKVRGEVGRAKTEKEASASLADDGSGVVVGHAVQ
jgi:hypothetical protein